MSEYTGFSTDYPTPEDEVMVLRMEVERLRGIIADAQIAASAVDVVEYEDRYSISDVIDILKRAEANE